MRSSLGLMSDLPRPPALPIDRPPTPLRLVRIVALGLAQALVFLLLDVVLDSLTIYGFWNWELTLQKFKVQGSEFNGQDEAEECFRKAIDVAQKQSAKSWELRAATSLARLWQQQGKIAEAHQLLSEIYNWFTEGFDTKDLIEAKTLLEKLG